jgi:hypothetical protein
MDWILCGILLLILIDQIIENARLSKAINSMKSCSGGWTKDTFYGGKK